MKVLLCSPTHQVKEYATQAWIKHAIAIRDNSPDFDVEIMMVDNSPKGSKFSSTLTELCKEQGIYYKWIDFASNLPAPIHERISRCMNYCRDYVLENKFDLMYIVEADVLPSKQSLTKLYEYMVKNELDAVQGQYYDLYTRDRYEKELKELGHGFWLCGVNLIKVKVFKVIEFRYEMELLAALPDAFLGHDLNTYKFKSDFHPTIRALHLDNNTGRRGWLDLNESAYK